MYFDDVAPDERTNRALLFLVGARQSCLTRFPGQEGLRLCSLSMTPGDAVGTGHHPFPPTPGRDREGLGW